MSLFYEIKIENYPMNTINRPKTYIFEKIGCYHAMHITILTLKHLT